MKYVPLIALVILCGCHSEDSKPFLTERKLTLSDHDITYYHSDQQKSVVVVFESGLGDDAQTWNKENVARAIADYAEVIVYDRAGYGKSTAGAASRTIPNLSSDLHAVISAEAGGRKIILVGHSIGGMIVRDYAIFHPDHIGGILFVDPSHEDYNHPTQEQEDEIYNAFNSAYGEQFGGTLEAHALVEDTEYMKTLPALPDVPVIVLTSLKVIPPQTADDREQWFNAHASLEEGVSDFTHLSSNTSGHYFQYDDPELVIGQIKALLEK